MSYSRTFPRPPCHQTNNPHAHPATEATARSRQRLIGQLFGEVTWNKTVTEIAKDMARQQRREARRAVRRKTKRRRRRPKARRDTTEATLNELAKMDEDDDVSDGDDGKPSMRGGERREDPDDWGPGSTNRMRRMYPALFDENHRIEMKREQRLAASNAQTDPTSYNMSAFLTSRLHGTVSAASSPSHRDSEQRPASAQSGGTGAGGGGGSGGGATQYVAMCTAMAQVVPGLTRGGVCAVCS